jgi:AcrR family transcriptional regulator
MIYYYFGGKESLYIAALELDASRRDQHRRMAGDMVVSYLTATGVR